VRCKTGATKEGKLLAMDAEVILDTGAYASYGPGVITRTVVHLTGPYEIPNVRNQRLFSLY
jgi:CO/xanthine dehydrogenase Mo-binding subunit